MKKLSKKRGLFLGLCASFILVAAGCGNDDTATDDETASSESAEVVTTASISSKPEDVVNGLSEDGTWIFAVTDDVTVEENLTVAGTFHDGGEDSGDVYRKLALYAQDEDRNVTDEYKLTAPQMIVESPNFRIQNGTFVGDIEVKAEGFELAESTIEGDVTFETQELMDSAKLDEGTVTGEISVAE